MTEKRLRELIELHLDGRLTGDAAEELSRELVENEDARKVFWEVAAVHGLLQEAVRSEWLGAASPVVESKIVQVNFLRKLIPFAAAAAAIILAAVLFGLREPKHSPDNGVAILARAIDARWVGMTTAPTVRASLSPGVLRLESGVAVIEFYSGARVTLEGPAEFKIASAREASLRFGKVTAYVPPPARGFTVDSPAVKVVDLGTEFGINAPADPTRENVPVEVHVFAGKVELHPHGTTAAQALLQGQAVRVQAGAVNDIPLKRADFITEAEFARKSDVEARQRYLGWREVSREVAGNRATVVYYTFENASARERTLTNQIAGAPIETHGSIVGCEWAEGRWRGKGALDFEGEGDRVRLTVTQAVSQVTLMAWVQINALPHETHALLNSESESPGSLRWEITHKGNLRLGLARPSTKPEANWEAVNAPSTNISQRLNEWIFIATVFDGKKISHYIDGALVASAGASTVLTLKLDALELGNWGANPDHPNYQWARNLKPMFFARGLSGRIDEFALLSRALTAQEIQRLYEIGRPESPARAAKN